MKWASTIAAGAVLLAAARGLATAGESAPAEFSEYPRVTSFTPPDLSWVPRKLAKEPPYGSTNVRCCIFVLGNGRNSVMTLAWDESEGAGKGYDTLYADTNLNGKLGEEGERFFWSNDPAKRSDPKGPHELYLVNNVKEAGSDRVYSFRFAGVYKPDVIEYDSAFKMSSPTLSYEVGPLPGELKLLWSNSLATAPVYRFGGEPVPEVNGKRAGESLGTWKAGANASASVFLSLHGAPEAAQLRFYGSKFPSLAAAVRDNRWGKAGYPIVLLRVLDPSTRLPRETIPFGDSCPCAGGFAPQMILPSRVPSGSHEVVVRMLRVPELGGCADFVWPVTVENPFEKNPVTDPAFAALKHQFPDAAFATLRRADTAAERATLRDGERVIPAAATDTTLLPNNRDWDARHANTGTDAALYVGARPHNHADNRSLLCFDLSGVPKETAILGARLRLALVGGGEGGAPYGTNDTLEAYALCRPWNERQDNPDGYACWFGPRFRGKLRSETWAQEGVAGEGTDRDAKPAGRTTAMRGYPDKARNELVRFVDLDLTDLVKAWHAGTRPNYGVLLQMRGTGGGSIASSEQGDYPFRPALVIAYRGSAPVPTYTPRPGEDLEQALPARPRAALPTTRESVTVDGARDEAAWKSAGVIEGFQKETDRSASVVATRVLALAGRDALYLAGLCPEPKPEAIVAKADTRDADQVWQDDCIEFFVEPVKGSGEERHFAVSSRGILYDSRNGDKAWNGDWTATAKRAPEGWDVEVRIPWATLGWAGQPKPGAEIGFNVGRLRNADGEGSQWSPTGGSSHQPVKFGTLNVEQETTEKETSRE